MTWSPSLLEPSLVAGEHLVLREVAADRADVLGAGGAVLVTDRPVLRIGIDKTRLEPADLETAATALAELVEIDPVAYAARAVAAGPSAFVEALVVRTEASPVDPAALGRDPGRCRARGRVAAGADPRVRPADPRNASARRPPRSSPSPTARSRPATWSGCPGSSSATTPSCAGRAV